MRRLIMTIVSTVLCLLIIFPALAPVAYSEDVQIIAASPGNTVSYKGHASPNSDVRIDISTSVSIGTSKSGGNYTYSLKLSGIKAPSGMSMSVSLRPVDTMNVKVSLGGIVVTTQSYSVSDNVGSASNNNFAAGKYNVEVYGISNGSGPIKMDVSASQTKPVSGDGTYTYSISTSGLPASVYSIHQNGIEVAKLYLGVPAPATPTPEPTPTPTPTATVTPTATGGPAVNATASPSVSSPIPSAGNPSGPTMAATASPFSAGNNTTTAAATALDPSAGPCATPSSSAPPDAGISSDNIQTIILVLLSLFAVVEIYYVFFLSKKK